MKLYKQEKKETLRQIEKILMGLLHGHDDTVQLNIHDGLLGFKTPFRVTLTKQMTLDYYTHTQAQEGFGYAEGVVPHFLVLDVLVNTRYLYSYSKGMPSWIKNNTTPEDLALRIYHSYKHKRSGK